MTKFIIPIETKDAPAAQAQQQTQDKLNHPVLAVLLGIFSFIAAFALAILVLVFIPASRPYWGYISVIAMCVGLGVSAGFGINWIYIVARRYWRIDDEERKRRHRIEDMEYQEKGEPVDNSRAYKTYAAGYQILAQHYLYKSDCTRPEMEKEHGITQEQWNAVNEILVSLKIKSARSWSDMPYEKALALWEKIDVDPEACAFLVGDGAGSWKRIHV